MVCQANLNHLFIITKVTEQLIKVKVTEFVAFGD